jgi:GH18 family chitinase
LVGCRTEEGIKKIECIKEEDGKIYTNDESHKQIIICPVNLEHDNLLDDIEYNEDAMVSYFDVEDIYYQLCESIDEQDFFMIANIKFDNCNNISYTFLNLLTGNQMKRLMKINTFMVLNGCSPADAKKLLS